MKHLNAQTKMLQFSVLIIELKILIIRKILVEVLQHPKQYNRYKNKTHYHYLYSNNRELFECSLCKGLRRACEKKQHQIIIFRWFFFAKVIYYVFKETSNTNMFSTLIFNFIYFAFLVNDAKYMSRSEGQVIDLRLTFAN